MLLFFVYFDPARMDAAQFGKLLCLSHAFGFLSNSPPEMQTQPKKIKRLCGIEEGMKRRQRKDVFLAPTPGSSHPRLKCIRSWKMHWEGGRE
jgi:hypothetical protein